jgi:hypothetical protein
LFPKLPIEIRQTIWETTLKPRAVEIGHRCDSIFYSITSVQVALRVNKDSRNAAGFLYAPCFGSILSQLSVVFNFPMDTLYFDESMRTDIPTLQIGLKDIESSSIQSIAVDCYIDQVRE